MKLILLTGATGFLGKHLVNQLKAGEPETRLRLLLFDANPWKGDPQIEAVQGDVISFAEVDRVADAASEIFPLDDESIRMASHFWYCDSSKARTELGFQARDPMETLRDTVEYLRQRQVA